MWVGMREMTRLAVERWPELAGGGWSWRGDSGCSGFACGRKGNEGAGD